MAVAILGVVAVLAARAPSLRVDPGNEALFLRDDPAFLALAEFGRTFGGDELLLVALEGPIVRVDGEGLARLERLTEAIGRLPHVKRAVSLANARNVYASPVGVYPVAPYERVKDGDATLAELRDEALSEPLFVGNLVSPDGRMAAVVAEIAREEEEGAPDFRADLAAAARAEAAKAEGDGFTAHVAGLPVEKTDFAAFIRRDQQVFVPIMVAVLALCLALLFRQAWGVIVPLGVVGLSIGSTLGVYALAGRELNAVTSLLTPVVMVVSVTAAVNFLTAFAQARSEGKDREAAAVAMVKRVGLPCAFTTLTTAIGFLSLATSDVPAIRDFGVFCGIGVLLSYAVTLGLVPGLVSAGSRHGPGSVHARHGRIEDALARIEPTVASPRGRVVVVGAVAALAAAAAIGIARLRVETNILAVLPPGSLLGRAVVAIDAHLGGVNSLEVLLSFSPSGGASATGLADGHAAGPPEPPAERRAEEGPGARTAPGTFRDLERLRRLVELEALIGREEGVTKAFSIADFLARIHEVRRGERSLPPDQNALDVYFGYLDRSPDPIVEAFLSKDGRTARLSARVKAISSAESQRILRSIERFAAERLEPAGIRARPTGSFVLLSNMSAELVPAQVRGLGVAFALILGAMTALFASLRLGAVAAIPAAIPIAFVYGLMGFAGIALSVPTAMIASVVLGLAVDSTILFISRYRQEREAGAGAAEGLQRMLASAGQSVSYSNLILILGFSVGVVASFPPVRHFAILAGATLAASYVAAVLVLPALLSFATGTPRE